ncbi:MAG TPA: adenylate/guanylate cyclase domain-containing protein [Actinomycetota bacterium]
MPVCAKCGQENPEIARFCLRCGAALEAAVPPREVRKTVTVVFADVTGSTKLGERLDPESLRRVMGRYFAEMKGALERHGGTVEKFIGDAVMAVFGIPTLHEDDALRAVRAASEMRDRLAHLNDELERDWGVRLLARIGVNTGEVVAGDPSAGQTLVTGDAVNVAARLEQAAQPGDILIGASTRQLTRDAVDVESIDPLTVKGKEEPVSAFRLLDVRPDVEGVVRRLGSPMVGRERQRAALANAFDGALAESACHLFTVLGAAGVGKSRLVHEFLSSLRSEIDVRILRGRCLAYGEGITFWPVREVITQAAGVGDSDPPERAREMIASLLRESGERDELVPELVGQLLGLSEAAAPSEEMFWGTRKLLEALARNRPLAVIFDDIHWAEPTLLDLIEHVADLSRDAPMLLLCIARPELLERRPAWGGGKLNATSILLEPLTESESKDLIANLLGQAQLDDAARARIIESAEGNPLFVEEMLSILMDQGLLLRTNGHWTVVGDISAVKIPPTIQALIAARLDRLQGEERQVIEGASVVGQVFYSGAVTDLAPEAVRPSVPRHLTTLVRKDLIRPERSESLSGEETYRFRHILIRDAAYQAISKETRAELHEAFAGWLERITGDRVSEYEEILAYHLEQSYRYRADLGPVDDHATRVAARAAQLLASGGRRAFARTDLPAAVNLLERAAALLAPRDIGRLELLADLGLALLESGEYARADDVLEEATRAADESGNDRMKAHATIASMRVRLQTNPEGIVEEILRASKRIIPLFERIEDHQGLARVWNLVAWAHQFKLRAAERLEALERALEHARRAGDRREEVDCLFFLTSPPMRGPMPVSQALPFLDAIQEQARGDLKVESGVLWSKAMLEGMRGRFPEGREMAARSTAICHDLGMEMFAAVNDAEALGFLEVQAGDLAAAERAVRRACGILESRGERSWLSTLAADLALILCEQKRYQEAGRFVELSRETAASDDINSQAEWRRARAKILASEGSLDEAEGLARGAVALVRDVEGTFSYAPALSDLALILRQAERPEEAVEVLREALRLYELKEDVVSAERTRRLIEEISATGRG